MGGGLATTHWSQVLAARDGSDSEARTALESLCHTYWHPLYAYIRAQGHDPDEARDLTQGFFTEFLEKDFLADVAPDKGRFRSFLLASLRHYLAHQRVRERALKRGGGAITLSFDLRSAEERYASQSPAGANPEEVYEQRWAKTVIDRALVRLADEFRHQANESQLNYLKTYLTSGEPQEPYREAANALGMSEGAVRITVHRLRQRFGQSLRAEIAETVADPADTDPEVRYLLAVVRE